MNSDYRLLKLKSGEEIVTKIVGQKKDSITVQRPYEFQSMMIADPIGRKKEVTVLKDWLRHSSQIKTIIPKDFIVSFLEPDIDVIQLYEDSKERDDRIQMQHEAIDNMTEEEAQSALEQKIQQLLQGMKDKFDNDYSEDNMDDIDQISGMPNKDKGKEKEFVVMNMIFPPSIIQKFIENGFLDPDEMMDLIDDEDFGMRTFTDKDTSHETDREDFGSQWTDYTWNPNDLLDSDDSEEQDN
jgi:hypothetical protein|tara:strand:- start:512 stop:1231 length:720 start_codon:yes stop_codon:yes gene_type:complete